MTMQSTKQNAGGIVGFVDDLNGAIRENPVAAGLIGMGVLWMFFGSARISAAGQTLPGAARGVTNAVGAAAEAGSVVGDAIAGTAWRASNAARQVAEAISSGAEGAATAVRDTASYDTLKSKGIAAAGAMARTGRETGCSATEFGREFGTSMQQNLTQTLERQPLLLGMIGLGIGAGIASAFPSTQMERDVMGETGVAVQDKIREIATETTEFASRRAKEVLDEAKKEAGSQGLTSAAASESLKGAADKVKTVAGASRDSVKDRLS
jgi:hypothetical protein